MAAGRDYNNNKKNRGVKKDHIIRKSYYFQSHNNNPSHSPAINTQEQSPQQECSGLGYWFHMHQHSSTPPSLGWKTWAKTCYRLTDLQLLKYDLE